jgi:hypothetical protein
MRIATAATATLLSVAVLSGISEIAMRGPAFFFFRTAVGESPPTQETDQQFLAQEAAAGVHRHTAAPAPAPKGRHHKKADAKTK